MRKVRVLILVFVVSAALVGCSSKKSTSSACPSVPNDQVKVVDNSFSPALTCVNVGDTVTWRFAGSQAHNVKSETFGSDIKRDGTFEHRFDKSGKYEYRCTLHAGMNGEVQVAGG